MIRVLILNLIDDFIMLVFNGIYLKEIFVYKYEDSPVCNDILYQ